MDGILAVTRDQGMALSRRTSRVVLAWEANAARFEWIDRSRTEVLDVERNRVVENLLSKAPRPEFRLQWLWALEATGRLGAVSGVGTKIKTEMLASLLHAPSLAPRKTRERIR